MSTSLSTTEVGGGIWRIKWDPHHATDVIIAGMYSGFFWLKYNNELDTFTQWSSFKEHGSIAYGADICHLSVEETKRKYSSFVDRNPLQHDSVKLLVTCSFYDKKLCLCAF